MARYALKEPRRETSSPDDVESQVESEPLRVPTEAIELLCKWPIVIETVSKAIARLANGSKRIVIVIDGLDQLDEPSLRKRLHWVPRRLPEHIALVLGVDAVSSLLGDRDESWPEVSVASMSDKECRTFISSVPSVFSKTISTEHAFLLLVSLRRVCQCISLWPEELRNFGGYGQAGEVLRAQIENLPSESDPEVAQSELFATTLHRIGADLRRQSPASAVLPQQVNLAANLLGFIARSRDGLSATELRGVMAEEFPTIPPVDRR